ncbi:hypothetical protein H6801_04210 [Candidatus Nomurabacteria bacterium]|jgi:hypothetical protein|nr:hypothetical protein [Candidatus Nomurabacteria bacterium]
MTDIANNYPAHQEDLSPESLTEANALWYRCIGPNTSMESIPVIDHVDAITSSILDILNVSAPETPPERLARVMNYTTDRSLGIVSARLALEGDKALPLIDMILELSERDEPKMPRSMKAGLLKITESALAGIKTGVNVSHRTRLSANAKLSNARIALLNLKYANNPTMTEAMYSDEYIEINRAEAKWFSENTVGANAGDLFENYITCLMRQAALDLEADRSHHIRHATIREDQPAPRRLGGKGHAFAHDIHIILQDGNIKIQCKQGSGAYEAREYDPSVIVITETSEDYLTNNRAFKEAFIALAESGKERYADYNNFMISRYKLERILMPINPIKVGSPAVAGSAKY